MYVCIYVCKARRNLICAADNRTPIELSRVRSKTNYQYTGSCKILCTATVRVLFDAESVQAPLLQMQINLQYTTRTRSQANVNLGGRFA